jgi:hypothetical protein
MFRAFVHIGYLVTICLLIVFGWEANAQEKTDKNDAWNLFASDSPLELYIYTDLQTLLRDIGKDNEYHKARLSYYLGDSIVSMQVKIKTRGKSRRDRKICTFPPLKLKFDKAESSYTFFHDQKKLKLVTHCKSRSSRYQQMLIQEYLIYKLYNVLTPESFNVRLVKIHYKDITGKMDPVVKYSFFIEDFERMADRNQKFPRYNRNIQQKQTDIAKSTRLALFQYMIGNTDWEIKTLHNIKLLSTTINSRFIPVPYDFDWCSLVDAPYAIPNEKLDVKSIHERLYRGFKRTEEELECIFREFRMKKKELYNVYRNCSLLSEKEKDRVLSYFDEFYQIINNPSVAKREFIKNARIVHYR